MVAKGLGYTVLCWPVPNIKDQDKRYEVQSVARAAVLLDLVGNAAAGGLGVTEIAGHLKVAKSTALSLARTLSAAGLLRAVEPGPRYVLGLSCFDSVTSSVNRRRSPNSACQRFATYRVLLVSPRVWP